jgi:putative aldouronate transport system substrate-binding protein
MLLAFCLGACGISGSPSTSSESKSSTSQAAQASQSENESPEAASTSSADTKYDPPITITMVSTDRAISAVTYDDVNKSYMDNVWIQEYLDRHGIKVEYLWVVDSTQYDQKFNLALSSGDIPDIVSVTTRQLFDLIEADVVTDLGPAYENASDYVKKYTELCGELAMNMGTSDGKLYGIPNSPSIGAGSSIAYIRYDWLEKLGLEEPKTMQDFIDIATAFAKNDPNETGRDDTIGLPIQGNPHTAINPFYNAYGAYPNIWVENEQGELEYGTFLPEAKNALLELQTLFADGVITQEFGTYGWAEEQEAITSGRQGILFGEYWHPLAMLQSAMTADEQADWRAYPVMSFDGSLPEVQCAGGFAGYYAVSNKCQNPEAVFLLLDVFIDLFLETKDFETYSKFVNSPSGDEIWQLACPVRADDNVRRGIGVHESVMGFQNGSMSKDQMVPEAVGVSERAEAYRNGDRTMWSWDYIYKENGSMSVVKSYFDNNQFKENMFFGPISDDLSRKTAALAKLVDETYINIVKGADISEFDKARDQWLSIGGDEYTKQVNEWYQTYK